MHSFSRLAFLEVTFALEVTMSAKCLVIGGSFCFVVFTIGLFYLCLYLGFGSIPIAHNSGTTLSFSSVPEVVCDLSSPWLDDYRPSLQSFLQASTTNEDQDLRLSGLGVLSTLANACQPLVDVNKAKMQINKIALVRIENKTVCLSRNLVLNAQNAGYSVVIYFQEENYGPLGNATKPHMQEEVFIPFASAGWCDNNTNTRGPLLYSVFLKAVDKTSVNIIITGESDNLKYMKQYLKRLYYWFLLGPVITLEWLRRTKKLCCVTISQHVVEESAAGTRVEESREENIEDITGEGNQDESQPLTITIDTNLTRNDNVGRCRILVSMAIMFGRGIRYFTVCLGCVILALAALPVGLSSGGWSFFRFDERERDRPKSFFDDLTSKDHTVNDPLAIFRRSQITIALPVWWAAFQIFCFFVYSKLVCKSTWTVSANFTKLIRSDWFSSNLYLLVLCVVVPYCSLGQIQIAYLSDRFFYFTVYNLMYTVCNFLFIFILNKHKVVTRYMFYISVCMICAYVESDIVAVFYFILNSQGALNNLKLTALRTLALGLTLTLSFSSSMHIIRKLVKPQESLFEGLSER